MKKVAVDSAILDASFFRDDQAQLRKVIILLGGSEGGMPVDTYTEGRIRGLIQQGYGVLCLAYFGTAHLTPALRSIPLEYFERAFAWLASQPDIIADHYALVGISKGGELALLLGSRYPQVKAVVALVPSHVVFQSIPRDVPRDLIFPRSSWAHQGQDLPYIPFALSLFEMREMMARKYLKMYERSLANSSRIAEAAIPVEQIQGPILLISGSSDEMWPSTYMSEQVRRRLVEKMFKFHCEHVVFETGHNILHMDACWLAVESFLNEHFRE